MKAFLQKSLFKKKIAVIGIIGIILLCVLAAFFVLSPPGARSQKIQATSSPGETASQFYNNLMEKNYSNAYLLLSTNVRQQFEGGAMSFQQRMQVYVQQYGNITAYLIKKQTIRPGAHQIVVTVRVDRTGLQVPRREEDTLTLVSEDNGYFINQYGFVITFNPV